MIASILHHQRVRVAKCDVPKRVIYEKRVSDTDRILFKPVSESLQGMDSDVLILVRGLGTLNAKHLFSSTIPFVFHDQRITMAVSEHSKRDF